MGSDLDALQGLWRLYFAPGKHAVQYFNYCRFDGDSFTEICAKPNLRSEWRWSVKLEPAGWPKRFTMSSKSDGPNDPDGRCVHCCAYHLKGDVLRICKGGDDPPRDVSDRGGSLIVLIRDPGPLPEYVPPAAPPARTPLDVAAEQEYQRWPEILETTYVQAAAAPLEPGEVDLDYDLASLCGPLDPRVLETYEVEGEQRLAPTYVLHAKRFHGGVPRKNWFRDSKGGVHRLGRFLTFFDSDSDLPPPERPSWEFHGQDSRVDWSVFARVQGDCNTSRSLFGCVKLLPIAGLYWGPHHPDGMGLDGGVVDLLCFYFEVDADPPQVVVWSAHEAMQEYFRREKPGEDQAVRYSDFTIPVAPSFDAFLQLLSADEPE